MMQGVPQQRNGRPSEGLHLRNLWNFVLRNRLFIFGAPVLMVAATALFVTFVTPAYDAHTTIRIDEQKSNLPVLDVLKTLSSGSEINTEMEVLRSRTLAEDVVDSLRLQVVVERPRRVPRSELFDRIAVSRGAPESAYRLVRQEDGRFRVDRREGEEEEGAFAPGEPIRLDGAVLVLSQAATEHEEIRVVVQRFGDAVRNFRDILSIGRPNRDADIVVVRYEGSDPMLVHSVPNAVASRFLARRDEVRKTEAVSTVRFLTEQLDTLAVQLIAAEDRVRAFREGARVVDLEAEGKMYVDRLATLLAERDLLDAEREALAKLLAEVRAAPEAGSGEPSPYRRLIAFPTLLKNFAVSELFRSMAEVENQRAELLNRRTLEDPDVQVLTSRMRELERQLRTIAVTYLEGLSNQVESLDSTLRRFSDQLSSVPAKEVRFARLMRESEVLKEIYTMLHTRLKEAQIAAAVEDATVRVVDPAIVPERPIRPKKKLSLILAAALGVILGMGTAFVRENMDARLRTREELQDLTAGIPVLGLIPRIREAVNGNGRREQPATKDAAFQARLVTGRDPRNPISEAYRSLRTNITFANPERTPKTLVFTSALPGDGKSTSSANLAITLAQQGLRCLLIDADMRRGVLHDVFGVRRDPGLSNALLGGPALEDAVQRIDLQDGATLEFLGTGTLPPNPAELLGSARMRALLERFEAEYDAVILDAPPLNVVTDAAVLGANADGVIVVARAGVTERAAVAYAMEQLRTVRAPVLGSVLNDIDVKKERHYGSYGSMSYYYYGSGPEAG